MTESSKGAVSYVRSSFTLPLYWEGGRRLTGDRVGLKRLGDTLDAFLSKRSPHPLSPLPAGGGGGILSGEWSPFGWDRKRR